MRRIGSLLAAAAVLHVLPATVFAQARAEATSSFESFLPEFEAATRAFLDGDVSPWRRLLSTEPGGTLFTPFGQVVLGLPALEARYGWAAARFALGPARLEVEYLNLEVSGDLAFVVSLERSAFRRVGSDSLQAGYTRATMVFRRESGGWRLRHRHMDDLEAPGE